MQKFNIGDRLFPFTLTMLAKDKVVISGVRSVAELKDCEMLFRLHSGSLRLGGDGLQIVEIGGGDVYVKGEIKTLGFEE